MFRLVQMCLTVIMFDSNFQSDRKRTVNQPAFNVAPSVRVDAIRLKAKYTWLKPMSTETSTRTIVRIGDRKQMADHVVEKQFLCRPIEACYVGGA